jgi:hypothetical protein
MIWRGFWYSIWRASEDLRISLGRFAPWIFAQAYGLKKMRRVR